MATTTDSLTSFALACKTVEFATNFTPANSNLLLSLEQVKVLEELQLNTRVKDNGRQVRLRDLVKSSISNRRTLELLMVKAIGVTEPIKAL